MVLPGCIEYPFRILNYKCRIINQIFKSVKSVLIRANPVRQEAFTYQLVKFQPVN